MRERTYKPTPKRLRDARKKGQISKSKEIATCAAIVGLFIYLWIFFNHYLTHINQIIIASTSYYQSEFAWSYIECLKKAAKEMILLSVPFAICAMVIAILAYMLQFGVIFASEPIKPDFNRINPVEGFKRIFSWSNLLELAKSILKVLLLGSIIYLLIRNNIKPLLNIPLYRIQAVMPLLASILIKLIIWVSSIFIIVAILDYFFQKQLFIRKMKMNIDDVKREYKEREGDPQIRSQRRLIHRKLIMDDMISKIKSSTVIITHSNMIAVAIHYEYGKTKLPIVYLKGKYLVAERIIDIARRLNTPIFNDSFLAEKLFETGQENSYIPFDLIELVAAALQSVFRDAAV